MRFHSTLEVARRHLAAVDPAALRHGRDRLAETGIARLGFLLPYGVKRSLAAEALGLVDQHRQWNGSAEDGPGGVEVPPAEVTAHGHCIPRLYDSELLRHKLSDVAAERVHACPPPRRCTVTRTRHDDPPDRWCWGDYAFELVLVVECPELEDGGFVQTVAHTSRDRHLEDGIHRTLTRHSIRSWELVPGDLYLLRAGTTLHRVHPFAHGRRTALSMSFASAQDLERDRKAARQTTGAAAPGLPPDVRVITKQAQC
ncbi:hypothetical protein [Nocardia huaxiensis]|uniref:HalD/BesD family halogenase n=1 Tax=Nocardia huaxiensis TaxID=2755382 RepID=UPI001E297153|nr:hypothetical protein [Nocardia huaxiensis]UFS95257.1 hypothetical protein LPY97_31930 [Nocardia huaxiensis]